MLLSKMPWTTTGSLTTTSAMHLVIVATNKSLLATSRPRERTRYSAPGALPSRDGVTPVAPTRLARVCVWNNDLTMTGPKRLEPRLSVLDLTRKAMSSVKTQTLLRRVFRRERRVRMMGFFSE